MEQTYKSNKLYFRAACGLNKARTPPSAVSVAVV